MSATRFTRASRSSWIRPAALTNSSNASRRLRPPRRPPPPPPPRKRRRSSCLDLLRPRQLPCFTGGYFFPHMDLRPHIEKFSRRLAEVEGALSDPKVFANNQRYQELSKEYARLKELVAHGSAYLKTLADLDANRKLLKSEASDSELAQMAKEEIARLGAEEKRLALEVERGLVLPDPADSR